MIAWLLRLLLALPARIARAARLRRLRARTPALVLVAKHPTPGRCKTRLAASGLGEAHAAEVARAMLLDLLARHARSDSPAARVLLFAPPDSTHRDKFAALAREAGCADGDWTLLPMAGGGDLASSDLTAVLADALARVRARLAPVSTVVFIGSDAPTVGAGCVRAALRAGLDGRALLCPAEDGGYTLLGVPAGAPPSVFEGVAWSASTTAASQAARLAELGVEVELGRAHGDVDEAADLERLRALLAGDGEERAACPRLWALLEGRVRQGR